METKNNIIPLLSLCLCYNMYVWIFFANPNIISIISTLFTIILYILYNWMVHLSIFFHVIIAH